mmetsp:Transcript_39866/g.40656  ORF Transcript_39866/g.40656 Transcript_39866/m.40656 type:complete len:510 (+) Transcript_39866:43-1572(+)
MARRVEITVPSFYAELVKKCLDDPTKVGFGNEGLKNSLYVELSGTDYSIFVLTVPGHDVSRIIEHLRKIGLGEGIGQVILQTIDCQLFTHSIREDVPRPEGELCPSVNDENSIDEANPVLAKETKLVKTKKKTGFSEFTHARLTNEEIHSKVVGGAKMSVNTWFTLVGACLVAGGGLTTNAIVFIVAAMLVSPIMGPILGMTFGYRVADWQLFKLGFISCIKMTITAFSVGLLLGLVLGSAHNTYNWPTSAMAGLKSENFDLVISLFVSGAAGVVLAVSVTSGGVNSLVGSAISAGLLPPLVNAGMLVSYAFSYAPIEQRSDLYGMANYALSFFASHVIIIFGTANVIFWLKEINPKLKTEDDNAYSDMPTLKEYRQKIEEEKARGGNVKGFLAEHLVEEFSVMKQDVNNFIETAPVVSVISNEIARFRINRAHSRASDGGFISTHEGGVVDDVVYGRVNVSDAVLSAKKDNIVNTSIDIETREDIKNNESSVMNPIMKIETDKNNSVV